MFGLYGIVGMVLLLALGGAAFEYERAEVQSQKQLATSALTADAGHQAQVVALAKANADLVQQNQFKDQALSDQLDDLKKLQTNYATLNATYNQEKNHVAHTTSSDDGPAAPVLQYVLNSLCGAAERTAALSSSNNSSTSIPGVPSGSAAHDSGFNSTAALCISIKQQSEFGGIVLDVAEAYEHDASKLVTTRHIVDDYNAKVREMNAGSK